MAGTILEKGNNKYLLRYMHNGRRYNKTVSAENKKKATKLLNEFMYEIEHNKISNNNMLFNDFVKMWIEKYVERKLSAKTQKYYNDMLKAHITDYFNGYRLNEIKRIDIINFLDELNSNYAKASIDKYRKCLNTIFNYAIQCELLEHNPCTLVKSPNGKEYEKRENVYTLEQVNKLLKALEFQGDKKLIVELGLKCGLRRQEIMALNKEDIDFATNTLSINKAMIYDPVMGFVEGKTKTAGSNRTIYLPKSLIKELKKMPSGRLFNYDTDYISKWFGKFIKKNNLPYLTLHGLRHTHATLLIANGVDYKTVSSVLGHSQTTTTMNIYVHKDNENIKKASNIFENLF